MPVRARSAAWISAMASLPPSRRRRSSSSSASAPGRMLASSPMAAGGRSTSVAATCSERSTQPSQPASSVASTPASPRRRAASSTSGSLPNDAPSAPSSRGVARPAAVLPARRSMSRTPSSAARRAARASGSAASAATASSRASMASRRIRGERSHCRRRRAPIGVIVRSSTASSVPSVVPPRSDSTSSRLRRVISSSGIAEPGRSTMGRARWGTPPGWRSRR